MHLNPFRTGRGLSTFRTTVFERNQSLNPFGTGRGLSTHVRFESEESKQSQSLWNRAGSFDAQENYNARKDMGSQSLWNRAGSFDCKGGLEPWWIRLEKIASQLFPLCEK